MASPFRIPIPASASPLPAPPRTWNLSGLSGRLVELSHHGPGAGLTPAFGLVLDAQIRGEPTAWVQARPGIFFPPDAAEGGVDLEALAVVRATDRRTAFRAADHLLRSGAFGLVVLDLGPNAIVPTSIQARLAGLAREHDTAVLAITKKLPRSPSLGPRVSLRGHGSRRRVDADRFECTVNILKDKRNRPGWAHGEVCRGPVGLR